MLYYLEEFFDTLKEKTLRQNIIFRDCLPEG